MKSYASQTRRLVSTWKNVSNFVGHEFARKYYGKDADFHWIGDCIDVAQINDSYWSVQQMVDALDMKLTRKEIYNYDSETDGTIWCYSRNLKKNGKRK